MFSIVLLYAILAATFTIAKKALFYAKPFFLVGFRMTLAGAIMLLYQHFFSKRKLSINKKDFWLLVKTTSFHIYIPFMLEFWALQSLTSSKANLIYSATPFIAALLAYFLLSEKLSGRKFLGMLIGFLGLIPILLTRTDVKELAMEFGKISIPEISLLGAVVSGAYAWFLVKKLISKGYPLFTINGISMFFGGILALATSFFVEGLYTTKIFDLWPFLGWTILLIIVANIIVYNFYGWLLKKYSITFVTSVGYLCPIFGAFYGWFFLNEKITWHYFASTAAIALGLYIFYKQEKKNF